MSRPRIALFSLAILLLAAKAALAAISFSSAEPISAPALPEFATIDDVNNDDRSDVIVVSPKSDKITVYLGSPTSPSRFSQATVLQVHNPGRPAVEDLNGDNISDLAVPEGNSQSVWIFLGVGDGTFPRKYAVSFPDARSPSAVAIGDFDGVKNSDLAVADRRQGKLFIRLNNGENEPRFTPAQVFDVGPEPVDVRAADFSGDGKLDLATLNFGGTSVKEVAVLVFQKVQAGFPVFAPPHKFVAGEKSETLEVADFNSDGISDLAMVSHAGTLNNDRVDILLSSGGGGFSAPRRIEVPCPFFTAGVTCRARAVTAGDFDGNRKADLAVAIVDPRAASTADAMQILAGGGNGNFNFGPVISIGRSPLAAAAGDLNGDRRVDVAVATRSNLAIQAFINTSTAGEKPNGERCSAGDECLSGHCENARCCATQCLDFERCDVPGDEGICVPVLEPRECRGNNDCEETEACIDGFCCDGNCSPTENRCDVPGFEGMCIRKSDNGKPCSEDEECLSGFCRDGVCCNQNCQDGVCNIEGGEGTCQVLLPLGAPCDSDAECASNVCDVFDGICCVRRCNAATEDCSDDGTQCVPFATFTPRVTGEPGEGTPTHTATPTPLLPDGTDCDNGSQCESTHCVNNVCCAEPQCGEDEHCAMGSGECVPGTAPPRATPTSTPTRTATPTRTPTGIATLTPIGDLCGGECPPENCLNGFCVLTSRSGGCATTGNGGGGNVAMAALLPVVLWLGRRWQCRHARARVSSKT